MFLRHSFFALLILSGLCLHGQNKGPVEGIVSFVTAQSIYVKFTTTEGIKTGDTIFIEQGGTLIPALRVKDLSSISCVCDPISSIVLKVSDQVIFKTSGKPFTSNEGKNNPSIEKSADSLKHNITATKSDTSTSKKPDYSKKKSMVHGFVNVASYSDFSSSPSLNLQREKLTFSLNVRHPGNSGLSAECYMSWFQNDKQYNETSNSIFNSLKIYSFDLGYDFGKRASLFIGRKLNPKLSEMGSNDGLQFELKFKPISIGVIAGFRPDFANYGFNSNLFQAGLYLFNEVDGKKGFMQTTLAFINQTNTWKTDRRFLYLQHVNSLAKNLTFYGSLEVDIFAKQLNSLDSSFKTTNQPKLTNLYLSLNYRIMRRLGISLSYSDRQNVIYYETYKTYLDKLLDNQNLQGYSLQINYSPVNNLSIGGTGSYRFQQADPKPTENVYAYLTYSRIPGINTSITLSTILLRTSYINGKIYSAGLSKDLAAGKLYLGLTYLYVDYHYFNTENIPTLQNMGEFSLTWRIIRKLLFSVYYEGTFDKYSRYHRVYAQLNLGF